MPRLTRQQTIARTFAPSLLETKAYHVPSETYPIKLNAMESPYSLPMAAQQDALDALDIASLNRYPDASHHALHTVVRDFFSLNDPDIEIVFGNGSDELIQLLLMSQIGQKRTVLAPDPSFVMYRTISQWMHLPYQAIPLRTDFSLDSDAAVSLLEQHDAGLIFIAQPNNPTGNLFATADIVRVIEATDALVVLDEAYFAFHQEDYVPLLQRYPNLVIMRTFSKVGLAGLRLGCLIGHKDWIRECNKLRLPYNIDSATLALAQRILTDHKATLTTHIHTIFTQRAWLYTQLEALDGLQLYPSATNFICFRTPPGAATRWFTTLQQHGILIKNLDTTHPRLKDHLRVTVGTQEECAACVAILQTLAQQS